jgi:hypothetical protein
MTQRESPRPGSENVASRDPLTPLAVPFSSLLFCSSSSGSFWEEWYGGAPDSARIQVLQLAREQGIVTTTQLPPREQPPARPSLLIDLLAGPGQTPPLASLPPVQPVDVAGINPELSAEQRLAVARALGTPDLALVRGYPGTGKSVVVAEILRQASVAGLRTLFVAATAAGLNVVLEKIAQERVRVVRCLGPNESLAALPACVARLTLQDRIRHFEETVLPAAAAAIDTSRATWEARCLDETTWSRLQGLLEKLVRAEESRQELESARPGIRLAVEAELEQGGGDLSPLRAAWLDCQRRSAEAVAQIDICLAGVQSRIDRLLVEQGQCEGELRQLLPLLEARQGGKWWTGSWWRATFQGDVQPRVEQLRAQAEQLAERLQSLQREAEELTERRREAERNLTQQRRELIERELGKREAELELQYAVVAGQLKSLNADWDAACAALSQGTPRPSEASPAAVTEARAAWRVQLDRDEQAVRLRQEWLQALEQTLPVLAEHLARRAEVVAGTSPAISEAPFGSVEDFDLVVIDEAHRLTEADLHAACRRARRWVLVGDFPVDLPATAPAASPRRDRGRPAAAAKLPFEILWNSLHADLRRAACSCWHLVDDRLVCALRPVTTEQQRWLQREPIFDRPEIELGIVSPPGKSPQIVEVSFPATTSLEDARTYLFQELEELAVQPAGLSGEWRQGAGSVTLVFDLGPDAERVCVCLGDGIHEHLVRLCSNPARGEVGWKTAALEFDCASGWDLDRARAWVEERLGCCPLGRTTVLARPHRAQAPLACFLSGLLYAGACGDGGPEAGSSERPAVEFVAVPSLAEMAARTEAAARVTRMAAEPQRGGTATLSPRLRAVRGGAGLEVELADVGVSGSSHHAPRRTDLLPADIRALLPARGLVNYLEAQAIVSALEALVSDPDFQSASAAWQQGRSPGCPAPSVAVLCLFPAQVELIRLLMRRSPVFDRLTVPVQIGLPGCLAHRECLVALVGLTRSHTHRAVPFSDTPEDLVQALTRSVSRLVLFGDLGTLVRRSQWHGALDHLDESAGPLEQRLIAQLLAELSDLGAGSEMFRASAGERAGRPRESSSV